MSIENEKLSEGDVLKEAEDAAAKIKARRAERGKASEPQAAAGGIKEERVEIKLPDLSLFKGADKLKGAGGASLKQEEQGIENEILAGEATPSAPKPTAFEQMLQAAAVSDRQGVETGGEKQLTGEQIREAEGKLEKLKNGWETFEKKFAPLIKEATEKKEAEKKAREEAGETAEKKERSEMMARLEKLKQRHEAVKDSPKIPQELKNEIEKKIEEMEKRLRKTDKNKLGYNPRTLEEEEHIEQIKNLLDFTNKFYSGSREEKNKMLKLLTEPDSKIKIYAIKDMIKNLTDITNTTYTFVPNEYEGGWFFYSPEGSDEAYAVPGDIAFFEVGQVMIPVQRMFEGCEKIPDRFEFEKVISPVIFSKLPEDKYKRKKIGSLLLKAK